MNFTLKSVLFVCTMLFAFAGFAQNPQQAAKDEQILKEYFAKNKIKATRTPSGLYYVITKKGTGPNAQPGQNVTMNYYGKFLDGKKFDANVDDKFNNIRPFAFMLGRGQVIKGWDEGVALLNKGCRATLYLPSGIAYGDAGRGPIPPATCLVFDVEMVSAQ